MKPMELFAIFILLIGLLTYPVKQNTKESGESYKSISNDNTIGKLLEMVGNDTFNFTKFDVEMTNATIVVDIRMEPQNAPGVFEFNSLDFTINNVHVIWKSEALVPNVLVGKLTFEMPNMIDSTLVYMKCTLMKDLVSNFDCVFKFNTQRGELNKLYSTIFKELKNTHGHMSDDGTGEYRTDLLYGNLEFPHQNMHVCT